MKDSNKRIPFILIVVAFDTAGLGLIYPVLPELISELLHSDISAAARYGGWLTFVYAFMQFLFASILGNLSDQYGRRAVLLFSLLGFSMDYLFMAFSPNIIWLFIGRFISGITGSSYSVASASVADISTKENRTKNFGLINAAYTLGLIIGPVIGGLMGQWGTRVPFIAAAVLSLGNFIFGFFYFPESLPGRRRRRFEWKRAHALGSLKYLKRFPLVLPIIGALFLVSIASQSMPSVWAYFTIEKFNWDTGLIGYSLAFMGLLSVIVQSWLVGRWAKRAGEEKMTLIGLLLAICGLCLVAFVDWAWLLFPALIVYVTGNVWRAGFQGIITAQVPDNEQGELQGSLASLLGLATIIAPPLMTGCFSYFSSHIPGRVYFPGMPYLLGAFLTLISFGLLLRTFKKMRPQL